MISFGFDFGSEDHLISLLRFFSDGHASSTTIEVCEAGADTDISKETSPSSAFFFDGIAKDNSRESSDEETNEKLDPFLLF